MRDAWVEFYSWYDAYTIIQTLGDNESGDQSA